MQISTKSLRLWRKNEGIVKENAARREPDILRLPLLCRYEISPCAYCNSRRLKTSVKSATVSMMPMTMKKFAVPLPVSPSASALAAATFALEERGQADGKAREDARKHGERGIGAGGHGAADEVHQQEAVDGLRQGRAGEGDHDEGSGLAVRVALLPRADARLRREACAERALPMADRPSAHAIPINSMLIIRFSSFDYFLILSSFLNGA